MLPYLILKTNSLRAGNETGRGREAARSDQNINSPHFLDKTRSYSCCVKLYILVYWNFEYSVISHCFDHFCF